MSADSRSTVDPLLAAVARSPEVALEAGAPPGTRVGRFEILREIGRGGFGLVYEARDTELGRHVALKALRPARAGELDLLAREARAAARLAHPNVVTLHDHVVVDGRPYLVFELLAGETLAARLERGPLAPAEALAVAADIARALIHAHAHGVVHRDLKPANIFVTDDGQAKVLDFGIARLAIDHGLGGAGTPAYMAPEQRRGGAGDERSDLFGLGRVLLEMLGGATAGAAGALAQRLSAADPSERPASARAALDALLAADRGAASGEPYRWLDAFGEADAGWFFGREREVAQLRARLAERPLVAVVGPSGAGKSSLVHAGLVPRLRAAGWTVRALRPGPAPLAALAAAVGAGDLAARPGRAGEALRAAGGPLLLVVDQLEELYAQTGDAAARRAFTAALLAAADNPASPVRVVVTVRDDFLGRVAEDRGFAEAVAAGVVILAAPGREALLEALEGPARRAGYELDPGLGEDMVAALAAERAPLPLLQLAASRLWEGRDAERRLLGRAPLDAAGGVPGLLAAHANAVIAALPDVLPARRLLCELVTAQRTRRAVGREALLERCGDPAAGRPVLERLVAARLLTASRSAGGEHVELAHEALIDRWSELRRWLDEDDGDLRLAEAVARAAAHWVAEGRPAALLPAAARLREWLAWRARRGAHRVGSDERALLAAAERRARRRRVGVRVGAAATAVALAAAAVAGALVARRYHAREEAAQQRLLLARALEAANPVAGTRLFLEAARRGRSPGALDAALRLAQRRAPELMWREPSRHVKEIDFSPDGSRLALLGDDGAVAVVGAAGEVRMESHDGGVKLAWSPDGSALAVGESDGGVWIWRPGAAARLLGRHAREVNGVAWSSDGALVASGAEDDVALVWPAAGGAPRRFAGHARAVMAVAFSPDGRLLATASADRSARLWPLAGGAPRVLGGYDEMVVNVSFSRDGRLLATASTDSTARVYRVDDAAAPPVVLRGHAGYVGAARFDRDGRRVLTESVDGTARIWRADGGGEPVILRSASGSKVMASLWTPDGERVAVGALDTVELVSADGTGDAEVLAIGGRLEGMAMSPDGRRLATSDGANVRVWRLDDPGEPVVLAGHARLVTSIWPLPDGARLLTTSNDGAACVWRAAGGPPLARLDPDAGTINDVALRGDGGAVLLGYDDGSARVWPTDGGPAVEVARGPEPIGAVAWSGDGTRVVVADLAGAVRVVRADGGGELARWQVDGRVRGLAVSGERVYSAASGGGVRAFTLAGAPVAVLVASGDGHLVKASADGAWLATGGDDGALALFALPAARPGPTLPPHVGGVSGLAFDRTGTRLVSAGYDGRVRLYSLRGDRPVELAGPGEDQRFAAFSPDGGAVVVGGGDGVARVWSVRGTDEPALLRGHILEVFDVGFTLSGDRVLTGGMDRTARVWRWRWDDLVAYLAARTNACLDAGCAPRLPPP